MKGYRLFLAYYTLLAAIGLFVWSIFFGPKPQSLLLTVLLIPMGIYFWLVLAGTPSPETEHRSTALPLVILTTLLVSIASIFAYASFQPKPVAPESDVASQIEALRQEIAKLQPATSTIDSTTAAQLRQIKADLARLSTTQNTSTGSGSIEDNNNVGIVTIKDSKSQTIPVYQDKTLKGTLVGKLEFGKTYPFIDKDKTWYLILLSDKQGYVDATLVKEVK